MKIELLDDTFSIVHNSVEFVFKNDKRSLFAIMIANFHIETILERAEKDLIEIKGATDKEGNAIKPADFRRMPLEYYTTVASEYRNKLEKSLTNNNTAKAEVKKKSAKK